MQRLLMGFGVLAALAVLPWTASASLIGVEIGIDRTVPAEPFSWCMDIQGLSGPCPVTVAAGNSDRISLSGGNNLYADVEEASIHLEFGPEDGDGGPNPHFIIFSGLNWGATPGSITGFSIATDLPGMDESRISFTADSVTVEQSGINYDGGEYLDIFLQVTHVPEPSVLALLGVALIARRPRRGRA